MEKADPDKSRLSIELLSKRKELAHELATWAYNEWHRRNNTDFHYVMRDYEIRANSQNIPSCWIALYDEIPVGMVSLKKCDLFHRLDLFPWLSALYVLPQYRGRGIGSTLIDRSVNAAKELKYTRLYLFTDRKNTDELTNFYTKRHWVFFDKSLDMQGHEINILAYYL